ncbi:MAG: xanthine dehydrogenase family protein subunit M [Lautropia sp.]|nr:MAG: xanthine dehydrogenase family protein subunit M [Pseudomonadota bacterium]MBC6958962.1 xanthine dehydrogenase family protein subunit M [Lautropia sp.]MCL4701110.1 xanthine dehydrogenase family protein subunit M [Burkholderiaceae bacterium]MDL1908699.1 xanthine dehydrogenase family protein subunit M [Betaproteobacteria bacterium PRO1]RIK90488.1 MAG: molybdopterin dehydrogenase [Burkholderiales bacterium]
MKAPSFDYVRATSLDHALDILAERGADARVLAGGQSLIPALNMRLQSPPLLVDIGALDELRGITIDGDVVRIGALARHRDVEDSQIVEEHVPLIHEAIRHVAHPAIRNRGTFGGSLALGDPAAELPACAVALDARIMVASTRGRRTIGARDFYRGLFDTALEPDELIVQVEIDAIGDGWRSGFCELARRRGDFALVGLAAHMCVSGSTFEDGRLVFFGVGGAPTPARHAWEQIKGRWCEPPVLTAAREALSRDLDPPGDTSASAATRMHLAQILLSRVVVAVAANAEGKV